MFGLMEESIINQLFILSCKVVGFYDEVFIYSDATGKFRTGAVVVVIGAQVIPLVLPYDTLDSSALAELGAFKVAILLAKFFSQVCNKVQVRSDNRGVVEAYKRALQGIESKYPIRRKLVDFVNTELYNAETKRLSVRWIRGHSGEAINELCDHLARYETLDNVYENKFKYFDQIKEF